MISPGKYARGPARPGLRLVVPVARVGDPGAVADADACCRRRATVVMGANSSSDTVPLTPGCDNGGITNTAAVTP